MLVGQIIILLITLGVSLRKNTRIPEFNSQLYLFSISCVILPKHKIDASKTANNYNSFHADGARVDHNFMFVKSSDILNMHMKCACLECQPNLFNLISSQNWAHVYSSNFKNGMQC